MTRSDLSRFTQIQGNVFQILAKFLENGKATIRLKEPAHDLYISKVQ